MQGERKPVKSGGALIKPRSGVNTKRPVRVYEDNENPDPGKRLKTHVGPAAPPARHLDTGKPTKGGGGAKAPLLGLGRQRRPLADINNVGGGAAKREDDLQKTDKGSEGGNCTQPEAGDVIKPITNKPEARLAEKELKPDEAEPRNTEEQKEQVPDKSDIILSVENPHKEKIHQQNRKVFSVSYYGTVVYKYLFAVEKRYEIPKNHLEGQVLDGFLRAVLIDWLAGVVDSLDLMQETFQLMVYILDKFMAVNKTTTKTSAQLVGLGALFVASKYEETESIELNDLTFFCEKKWSADDIKAIECTILKAVGFQLGRPLAIHFIRRLSRISGASPMEHSYAKYFADASLMSYQLCHVKPSLIAAASVFLAFCISKDRIDTTFWTPRLESASTYKLEDFRELLPLMASTVTKSVTGGLQGIQNRYSSSNLFCVSLMPGCRPETGIINHF